MQCPGVLYNFAHMATSHTTTSPIETRKLGRLIGRKLSAGQLVTLTGNLGAGKTTLVQGIAEGWGSGDRVTSPTFVLVNEYRRPDGARLYHMDAYRLSGPAEAEDLDIDAYLAAGPLLVEWAERITAALPQPDLQIEIGDLGGDTRRVRLAGPLSSRVRPAPAPIKTSQTDPAP